MKTVAAIAYVIGIICALFAILYLYQSSLAREGEIATIDVAIAMLIVVLPYCVARSLGGLANLNASRPEPNASPSGDEGEVGIADQSRLTPDQIRFEQQQRRG